MYIPIYTLVCIFLYVCVGMCNSVISSHSFTVKFFINVQIKSKKPSISHNFWHSNCPPPLFPKVCMGILYFSFDILCCLAPHFFF